MTKQELNRDIKRLSKAYLNLRKSNKVGKITIDRYFKIIDNVIRVEWLRLYEADNTLDSMNAASIRILLRMNLRHQFIGLFQFGLNVKL